MKYSKLGKSGLRISRFVLGTMQMGWIINEEQAHKVLDAALEAGINTIDTADVYSKWGEGSYPGKSEEIIGRWIKDRGVREEIVLATKVRGEMSEKPNNAGLSRKHILESAKRSIERLHADWIDLYWSHSFDNGVSQKETLEAYTKLINDGLVHYAGASNFTAAELIESLWVSDKYTLTRYVALQPPYSLARRRDFEKYLQPVVEKYDFGVTSYSPLGGGFLTGKYSEDKLPDSKRAETTKTRYFKERNFKIVDTLKEVAGRHDATLPQVALAWVLSKDVITAPIIGVNNESQLADNIRAIEIDLLEDDLKYLDEVSDWTEMDYIAR
jgi:aryl-alcohol dehydrogenase-like predicted oxidoreductase